VLTQLGIGEAIVTMLSENGAPTPVAWTRMWAPESLMGEASPEIFDDVVNNSPLNAKYMNQIDRESAYEMLSARHAEPGTLPPPTQPAAKRGNQKDPKPEPGLAEKILGNTVTKSMLRAGATAAAGAIVRSIFSTSKKR
jgi:hypothetical protein